MSEDRCRYTHNVEGVSQEEWRCPHETHEEEDLCVFHLPPARAPGPDAVSRAFREAIAAGHTEFLGATFGDLRLNGARIDAGDAGPIRLEFATIRGDVDLNDATVDSTLVVSSVTVAGALRCRRSTFSSLRLSHVAFSGPVEVTDARFRRSVTIGRDVSFERGADFGNATFESKLQVQGSVFGDDVSFDGAAFHTVVALERLLVRGAVDLEGATVAGLSCSQVEAERLSFDRLTAGEETELTVEGSDLGRLTLREATLPGQVVLAGNDVDRPVEAARIDLSGAEVRNADLTAADLGRARLRATAFRSTEFSGAILAGADLERADLAGLRLHGTDLRGARLADASLRDASLDGAVLDGATLDGADLQRAAFGTAGFYRASFEGSRLDRGTTFARYNHYDPAAVQADGAALPARGGRGVVERSEPIGEASAGPGGRDPAALDALDRLDRAVQVHRQTHSLLQRIGIPDTDDHDRRALGLRAAWYRGHALRSPSGDRSPDRQPDRDRDREGDGTGQSTAPDADPALDPVLPGDSVSASPSRFVAVLGAVAFGIASLLVDLGEYLRALIGTVPLALVGFAGAYPLVGGLATGGTVYRGVDPSPSLVRAAVSFSAERLLEGAMVPVRAVIAVVGATPLSAPLLRSGVEPVGGAIGLATAETGLGTIVVVLVVLGLVGRVVLRIWTPTE